MSTRERVALTVAAVVAGLLLVLWWQGRTSDREAQWQADRARLVASADSARVESRAWEARADSAERRSAAAVAAADTVRVRVTAWRTRVDTVTVPAAALPYTAPRDSLIRELTTETGLLRVALAEERTVVRDVRAALAVERVASDSLRALVRRAPTRRRWMPELRVGYAAGVDRATRKLFDGPAVSLGWRISL